MKKHGWMRFLCLLTALCLLCGCALGEAADEPKAEENETFETLPARYVMSMTDMDGTLLVVGENTLYRSVEGGWQKVPFKTESYMSFHNGRMDWDGGKLYCIDQGYSYEDGSTTGVQLYAYTIEDGAITGSEQLTKEGIETSPDSWVDVRGLTVMGDSAYALVHDDVSTPDWNTNELYRITLADGTVKKLYTGSISEVTAMGDGKLIGVYSDRRSSSMEVNMPTLVSIDAESGEMATLATLPDYSMGGLIYDGGYAYLMNDSELMRYGPEFGEPEVCAYLTPGYGRENANVAMIDGRYYYYDNSSNESEMTSVTTDPALLPAHPLRVAGYSDDLIHAFCKAHPEVPVTLAERSYTVSDLVQEMVSGGNGADVYTMYTGNNVFSALRDKGYCYDLSGNKTIADAIARMYPQVTAPLCKDGKIFAVPYSVQVQSMGYYPKGFEAVGLTEEDVPRNMREMLAFMKRWDAEFAEEYPDVRLFDAPISLYEQLFQMIFSMQVALCESQGQDVTFNTPLVRELLTELEAMKPMLTAMEPEPDADGSISISYGGEDKMLFSTWSSASLQRYGDDSEPLVLSMDESTAPALSTSMNLYFLNPSSDNVDAAMTFLMYIVENMDAADKLNLYPDYNEPCESRYYQENLEEMEKSLAMMEESAAGIDEANRADWESNLAEYRSYIETYKENERWDITAEEIASYRERAQYMIVPTTNVFSGTDNEASKLMERYMDGQIGTEQFIREIDRIVQMIQMEAM